METNLVYWGYIGIMEKKLETITGSLQFLELKQQDLCSLSALHCERCQYPSNDASSRPRLHLLMYNLPRISSTARFSVLRSVCTLPTHLNRRLEASPRLLRISKACMLKPILTITGPRHRVRKIE